MQPAQFQWISFRRYSFEFRACACAPGILVSCQRPEIAQSIPQKFIAPPPILSPRHLSPRNLSPRIVQFIAQKFIAQKFVAQSLSPRNLLLRFNVSPRNWCSILKQIVFHMRPRGLLAVLQFGDRAESCALFKRVSLRYEY